MSFTIVANEERYSNLKSYEMVGRRFTVEGVSLEQAKEIAYRLSNFEAGCDYAFFVVEDTDA